jgi:hypothetical protein
MFEVRDMEKEAARLAALPEIEFRAFPKIPRLKRNITITEKLDGTNACVIITEDGRIGAQARNGLIKPGKATDNYGFAGWVQDNADELMKLGPGYHFGEWWGNGIQRKYGMKEKVFSLFQVVRWADETGARPACCSVVPVIYEGPWSDAAVDGALGKLRQFGSAAAPGFMQPEGIIVWHHAARSYYKVLLENDDKHKGE